MSNEQSIIIHQLSIIINSQNTCHAASISTAKDTKEVYSWKRTEVHKS